MNMLTFLIFRDTKKNNEEWNMCVNVAPNWGKFFKFLNFQSFGRGTGNTGITIFAYGESHVKSLASRWPNDHSDAVPGTRIADECTGVHQVFQHPPHPHPTTLASWKESWLLATKVGIPEDLLSACLLRPDGASARRRGDLTIPGLQWTIPALSSSCCPTTLPGKGSR